MRLTVVLGFLFCSSLVFGQKNDSRLAGVDKEIENLLQAYKCVGLSVAVVENNRVIYTKGFGYRDYAGKVAATPNTLFPVGSITKSFTASLLGMQESKQLLSIKLKPAYYLPHFAFYNDKMDNLVTIEDLLCHKSGVGNADGSYIFFPSRDRSELMERLKYIQPEGAPKDSWIYSNMGYNIAGAIAEQVSGESWDKLIKQDIFLPLGMNSSSTSIAEMTKSPNFSYGYGVEKNKVEKVLFEQLKDGSPAGAINSTVIDMSNWMLAWLNGGSFNGKQVLTADYINEAMSMKAIDNAAPPEGGDPGVYTFGYGYGWKINSNKGHYKVHHGGNVSGFSANLALYPTDKLGIVVLTNQNSSILPYIITDLITNRMLRLPQTAWNKYPVKVNDIYTGGEDKKAIAADRKPTHELTNFCGDYSHPGYGTFQIVLEQGNLYAVFPDLKFRLEHQYYDIFRLKPTVELSQQMNPEFYLNFSTDNDGDISDVHINFRSEPVRFVKKAK